MSRLTIIWELVFVCLLAGLIMVRSTNIYANVGENIAITCPVDDVYSWTFFKTKTILAICVGQNTINNSSTIAKRLRISSDCKLQIDEFKKEDVGKYICFHPNKIIDGEKRHAINIQLRIQPNVSLRVYINSVRRTKKKTVIIKEGDMFELVCHALSYGTIETFRWTHNSHHLLNSTNKLLFEKVERHINGKYVCTAESLSGDEDSDTVNVSVEYPPLVKNKNRVFTTSDNSRILKCEVLGKPNIYKFNKWQHFVNRQHVRSLNGNHDGTLDLSYNNTGDTSYEDSGLYICNVTNNIRSENGQLWQTGTVNVTIKDKPVLAKPVQGIYIGQNISKTIVSLYLLSSSELSASNLNKGNGSVQITDCAASTVNTHFHGTPVKVSGYVCNVSITERKAVNFQNYSITVCNGCCSNMFNFSIRSAREPDKPNVLRYMSSTTFINVLLEPGSDGGIQQQFIIEYRKQQNTNWKHLLVENIGTSGMSYHIPSLDPGTAYEFKIIARNSIGNSSSTATYKVWTKDEKKSFWIWYTIIIIVTTAFIVCLIIICWRRKAAKSVPHRSQIVENSNQGGAIENSLYQSASDLTEPPTSSGIMETANRSIDRRKTIMNKQTVGYNIVGKEESTRTFDCEEMKYRKERNIRYDSSPLNYIEVVFDPGEPKSKFHIHGAENRTPYSEIDFSLTADPLTSSDDEECASSLGDNTDFVSLEDVQQWNINESLILS